MTNVKITLHFENRLNLNKDAGKLIHVFSEGYLIIDEYGREISSFDQEPEFNRLIKKFKHRNSLIEKLNESFNDKYDFGEDNKLLINGKSVANTYYQLPQNENDLELLFQHISTNLIS